jgi:hypothetical protein
MAGLDPGQGHGSLAELARYSSLSRRRNHLADESPVEASRCDFVERR